jgi:hypothetical protein
MDYKSGRGRWRAVIGAWLSAGNKMRIFKKEEEDAGIDDAVRFL